MAAIQRAEVQRGAGGDTASHQVFEFGNRVCVEKDVVMGKLWPSGRCGKGMNARRQASCGTFCLWGDLSDGCAKLSCREGARVAGVDNSVTGVAGAVLEGNAADAPVLGAETRDMSVCVDFNALRDQSFCQRVHKLVHAAFDDPDACGLGLPDEGQESWCMCGAAADIGGVTAKELRQARIIKGPSQMTAQCRERRHRRNERGLRQGAFDERRQMRLCRLHHRRIECVKERAGAFVKGVELTGGLGAREATNSVDIQHMVLSKVQRAAVRPEMPPECRLRHQFNRVVKPRAQAAKQVFEDMPHSQDRWAGIDGTCGRRHCADLSAQVGMAFQHEDTPPCGAQAGGCCEPGDAGPDDDVSGRLWGDWHRAALGGVSVQHAGIVDSDAECVQFNLHISVSLR